MQILGDNFPFLANAYGFNAFFGGMMLLVLFDLALKGWAMWRAARMQKLYWFVALLIVNSVGILPGIFLLMTNEEYKKKCLKGAPVVQK